MTITPGRIGEERLELLREDEALPASKGEQLPTRDAAVAAVDGGPPESRLRAAARPKDEGPPSADEWLQKQMPIDGKRHWLMTPTQRDNYLRANLGYWQERPSHPEWAPFDPPPPPGPGAVKDLPRGRNWFLWELRGRPDPSPLPKRVPSALVIPIPDLMRAFPDASPERGPKPDPGHPWPATIDSDWEKENIVEVPNRWGILSPYPKRVVKDGKVTWEPVLATIKCNRLVAQHLVAALDELDRRGLLYLIKTVDGFYPKYKSSGKEPSSHLFGLSLDLNQAELPLLTKRQVEERKKRGEPLPTLDDRVVAVFEKHGFSSGGDWTDPYDPMHIEYSDRKALGLE